VDPEILTLDPLLVASLENLTNKAKRTNFKLLTHSLAFLTKDFIDVCTLYERNN
jgi:hypothetical protein